MQKLEKCPKCGSIFVQWGGIHKTWRCLVRACGWTERYSEPNKWKDAFKNVHHSDGPGDNVYVYG